MKVGVIGKYSREIYCTTSDATPGSPMQVDKPIVETIGHDAPSVAYALGLLGIEAFLFCNPMLDDDHRKISSLNTNLRLDFVRTATKDEVPITVVLEDNADNRQFIVDNKNYFGYDMNIILESCFDFYYLDMYDECMDEILPIIQILSDAGKRIYINGSASSVKIKAEKLAATRINIFQASYSGELPEQIIDELFNILNTEAVVLTCGKKGAYVKTAEKIKHCIPANINPLNNIVGTGAFFSAGFIHSLLQDFDFIKAGDVATQFVSDCCRDKHESFMLNI